MLGKRINELPETSSLVPGDLVVVRKTDGKEYKFDWENVSIGPGVVPGRTASSNFTITGTDLGQFIEATSAIVITIPTEASEDLEDGFIIHGYNHSAGDITFSAGSVTLVVNDDLQPIVPPKGCFSLMKSRVAADTWILYGYLTATVA